MQATTQELPAKLRRQSQFARDLHLAFDRTAGEENVSLALRVIAGEVDPRTVKAAEDLERQCYNPPGRHYLTMTALDSLLGTCGTEPLGEVDMRDGPPYEYLNTGDPYAPTLVWYRSSGRFYVRSWGDLAERMPRGRE